jgi:hypothetical protein
MNIHKICVEVFVKSYTASDNWIKYEQISELIF